MADLPVPRQVSQLAKPNVKVKKLWLEQQIAEKQARIKRLEVDAFEIINGQLKRIEADKLMAEREVVTLMQQLDELERRNDQEVIDV